MIRPNRIPTELACATVAIALCLCACLSAEFRARKAEADLSTLRAGIARKIENWGLSGCRIDTTREYLDLGLMIRTYNPADVAPGADGHSE